MTMSHHITWKLKKIVFLSEFTRLYVTGQNALKMHGCKIKKYEFIV